MFAWDRLPRWLRYFYGWAAALSATHLLVTTLAGLLARHGSSLGLAKVHISRAFLPAIYHAGERFVPASVLASDSYSALLHGQVGSLVLDSLAAFWLTTTGAVVALALMTYLRRPGQQRGNLGPQPVAPQPGNPPSPHRSAKVVVLRRR